MIDLGGVCALTLARRYGTPLFVYSAAVARDRLEALRRAFTRREPLVCYALKANPNRALGRVLARAGAGADIVSGGELARAARAGFAPSKIVFSGVGKTENEMAAGLRAGLLAFNVESVEELEALARTAKRLKLRAPVCVRLNPDVDPRTHPHLTTGRARNKFGLETAAALALYRKASRDAHLRVVGIQCHIGSQITTLDPYRLAAASVARTIRRLEEEGIRLSFADLGGGIGIAYKDEKPFALASMARVLEDAFAPWPQMRLLLEPGRYLVADAGILLTRVLYRKKTSMRRFLIVDGAMTDLPRPALYGAWHPVEAVTPRRGRKITVDVVGPVCESGDFLALGRSLPPMERGDILAVGKAGAYGFAMSSQYNSRPRAAEVLVDGRRVLLARRRERIKDLYAAET
ncbi:MAG TPA: diaminopimelate decarboxylase [Elusimicrobia bacterium]|nr:MAG: diaminopimelate decarboxylase [Elusimicrobia bacterium GWA2_66_18]OGR73080.1 MAG: diaminopimelate decarboxylase [Elusimicrobia bacterium GWC2_65_9]HAZ08259.1 diaminopimelate decarboxylase [Elusimicrobiota bacterium]